MEAKDDLFQLIHSLSQGEKRYFVTNANKGIGQEVPDYLKLFKAISKMKFYDEKALKALNLNDLGYQKHYLKESILIAMRTYVLKQSPEAKIRGWIQDAKFLLSRDLTEQSMGFLKKAKKWALKYHRNIDLIEINRLERNIIFKEHRSDLEVRAEMITIEAQNLLESYEEEVKCIGLANFCSIAYVKKAWLETVEEKESFNRLFNNLKPQNESFKTVWGEYYYLKAQKYAGYLRGELPIILEFNHLILKWWDNNQQLIEHYNALYISDLFSIISTHITKGSIKIVPDLINKVEKIKPKNKREKHKLSDRKNYFQLLYLMNIGEFEEAAKTIESIKKLLPSLSVSERVIITYKYNFAINAFFLGDYWGAIGYMNSIQKNKNVNQAIGMQKILRVLKCICYLELGDPENFELSARATKRFMNSVEKEYLSTEKEIINLLRQINNAPIFEIGTTYTELKKFLKSKIESPSESITPGLNEYFIWVTSKIENKTLSEVYKRLKKLE